LADFSPHPLVSVIIPCYQQGKYLTKAVESVISQTYPHWELILVNDGSTDDTQSTAESLIHKYSKYPIQLIHQENQGASGARNTGILASRADFILPLDADDALKRDSLEQFISCFITHPEIDIVYPDLEYTGAKSGIHKMHVESKLAEELLYDSITPCSMFRKKVWTKIGGYDRNLRAFEDWDFWLSALESGFQFFHAPAVLYEYTIHQSVQSSLYRNPDKFSLAFSQLILKHNLSFPGYVIDLAKTRLTGYIYSPTSYLYARKVAQFSQNYRPALVELSILALAAGSPNHTVIQWDAATLSQVERLQYFFSEREFLSVPEELNPLLSILSDDPLVNYLASQYYFSSGDMHSARRYLVKSVSLFPNFLPSIFLLTKLYLDQNQPDEALRVLNPIIKLSEFSFDIRKLHLISLVIKSNFSQYLSDMVGILKEHPQDIDLLLTLADFSARAGDIPRALSVYHRVLALEPQNTKAQKAIDLLH